MTRTLRVAIDCRITDPNQGIGTAVLALAKALSDSRVDSQEYTFIVREDMKSWLAPCIYGPSRLEGIPESTTSSLKGTLRRVPPLRSLWRKFCDMTDRVPASDGFVESQKFDVVHFPTQDAYLTELPSIYQPHDLQHLHYPEFFSKAEFALRERHYRAFCDQATFVCVHAEWTKQDIINCYGLTPGKVAVIKWGTVFDAYETPTARSCEITAAKYNLPSQFFFYPAVTWPHKNHEIIIRALRVLKGKHNLTPNVYCTGASTPFRRTLHRMARELGVFQQMHYLGFVSPDDLQTIYGAATALVYASRFEGFGLPILEAFHAGVPVVCSNASVLPEIAQDGAVYFNPESPDELATQMKIMLENHEARRCLVNKGKRVLSQYSFQDTASAFQALYVQSAIQPTGEHRQIVTTTNTRQSWEERAAR